MSHRIFISAVAALAGVLAIAAPAGARPVSDEVAEAQTQAAIAQEAFDAANDAFVAGDYDLVLAKADEVDAADAAIEALLAQANDTVAARQAAYDVTVAAVDAAQVIVDAYGAAVQRVIDQQRILEGVVEDQADADALVRDLYNQLMNTPMMIPGAPMCIPGMWGSPPMCYPGAPMPNPAWTVMSAQHQQALLDRLALNDVYLDAQDLVNEFTTALGRTPSGAPEMAAAVALRDAAQNALTQATDERDAIAAIHGAVHPLTNQVRDRRLDIVDLRDFYSTSHWGFTASDEDVDAGDRVTFAFSIANSSLFTLSDVAVRVISPAGLTAICDLPSGQVAAGESVECTVAYEVTEADARAGLVTLTAELTGTMPVGPGHPRGKVVSGTTVTITESYVVEVDALVAAPTATPEPTTTPESGVANESGTADDELAQTGAAPLPAVALAGTMLVAGIALLLVRRRTRQLS